MATVVNLAVPGTPPDVSYVNVIRSVTNVHGAEVPLYVGEIIHEISSHRLYRARGLTNTDWVPVQRTV